MNGIYILVFMVVAIVSYSCGIRRATNDWEKITDDCLEVIEVYERMIEGYETLTDEYGKLLGACYETE